MTSGPGLHDQKTVLVVVVVVAFKRWKRGKKRSLTGLQYLVVHLLVGCRQRDRLLEDIVVAVELDALSPVIKGAGHKDLVSSMRPKQLVEITMTHG